MNSRIYLDHCSTTPVDDSVLDAMLPYFCEKFGNPGTSHQVAGGEAQRAVRHSREIAAEFLNCNPNELIWTSGATESNNLAILGLAANVPHGKRHLITQETEHSAVIEPCRRLEADGWDVTYLNVDQWGQVDVDHLRDALKNETSLVSIMWGNNEIGTIQPIEQIAEICSERGVPFHCDAAQAVAKVPIDLDSVPITLLTLSAHKFYGPKGCGALFQRDLARKKLVRPQTLGGGQEKGMRSGTLNVPAIVGLGAACRLAMTHMDDWSRHTSELRDLFEDRILTDLEDVDCNGAPDARLPNVSNLAFQGTDDEGLLTLLPDIVASTGAACHVADFAPSHVLTALRKRPDVTECSLRFGFGKDNTREEAERAADLVIDAVNRLRSEA